MTSAGVDAVLLAMALGLAALVVLSVWLSRELQPVRPSLPPEDRAPAGASRLVPVGRQVELDARAGLQALDLWLRAARARP